MGAAWDCRTPEKEGERMDKWEQSTADALKRLEEAPTEEDQEDQDDQLFKKKHSAEPKTLAEALKQKAEADKEAASKGEDQKNAFADALERYNNNSRFGRRRSVEK